VGATSPAAGEWAIDNALAVKIAIPAKKAHKIAFFMFFFPYIFFRLVQIFCSR
jgi:hypothetical protein